MGKLIPLILVVLGVGGGAAAGFLLKPAAEETVEIDPCGDTEGAAAHAAADQPAPVHVAGREYVKMNNQFVVPVVNDNRVAGLVVLSLSVEVGEGGQDIVYSREPKLRDAFLRVLFDHANMGGFDGAFTNSNNMDVLRNALHEAARKVVPTVLDVLIVDIARQDNA